MHLWTFCPRFSFFFLWSTPSTLSRQIRHLFYFPGLEGDFFKSDSKNISNRLLCVLAQAVAQCMLLLRSGVISCVANFQLKRMNSFLWFFEVFCCSILTMLQRLREQYRRCIKMQKQST